MPKDVYYGKTLRKSFARSTEIQDMPNLLEIQKKSYKWFLDTGLREVFRDVDAVTDYSGNLELSFVDYSMDEKPKYSEEECKARDATYAAPLKVSVRLRNKETEEIKEQEIFMGDFPLMTAGGTFVINGAERVIVSQIVRSPGVYYDKKTDKAQISTYGTTVIPYHGAWLEYETDANDIFYVRIDKNRKLPVTLFLKAMGRYDADKPYTWLTCLSDPVAGCVTSEQLKEVFANDERIVTTLDKDSFVTREDALLEIYRKLRPGDPPTVESSETLLDGLFFDRRRYDLFSVGRYKFNKKLGLAGRLIGHQLAAPVADPVTGELIAEPGEVFTRERAEYLDSCGVTDVTLRADGRDVRVFTNGMVDMAHFVDFDPAEVGVHEKVRLIILRQLLEQYQGDELKEAIKRQHRHPHPQAHNRGRHVRLGELSLLPCSRHRHGGRHRPPRQPPRPQRGRAAAKPVPHRLLPHGARHPRAHDAAGPRHRHPAEPHQHPARDRGHQGVLRLLAALPVHGPDQPPGRAHAQAPHVGPRPRRSEPREGELRRPRRPLQPLRPPLPHRDPRRPEHRPHQLPRELRPRQRIRLPGHALPQGPTSRTAS